MADALVQLADNALAQGDLLFLRTVKPHPIVITYRPDGTQILIGGSP